ncbi:hypothetical protein JB92DRAFT_3268199 [Gautieria morchelliformis]|nr:hypothetical protein JB92DRAFT_3268199 [Gautieria morchelliformis]
MFEDEAINGLMLHRDGTRRLPDGTTNLSLCPDCHSSLKVGKVLRFAFKNQLYRGQLPVEFIDLTWVEEMVCSLYRITAHVTQLYDSGDPAQPRVFHGNTCAHDMNVISVADSLPRSPADLNDGLLVDVLTTLRMWHIKPDDKNPNRSRAYQLILKRMQVLPTIQDGMKTMTSASPATPTESTSSRAPPESIESSLTPLTPTPAPRGGKTAAKHKRPPTDSND